MQSASSASANKEITIERIACPLHVLALKKGLDAIENDQTLKIHVGGANVSRELTAACQALGHGVEQIKQNQELILLVQKQA